MTKNSTITLIILVLVFIGLALFIQPRSPISNAPAPSDKPTPTNIYSELPQRISVIGYWECLPHKDTTGPQTMECAIGIALDQSDGHMAVNTSLISTYPVDFSSGTKVKIDGLFTPLDHLSSNSMQKYDIDGIISATSIEAVE